MPEPAKAYEPHKSKTASHSPDSPDSPDSLIFIPSIPLIPSKIPLSHA
jgi:hypothetical protein